MIDDDRVAADARSIVQALYDAGLIKTWYKDRPTGWRLVSGLWSPLYIQLRQLPSFPDLLADAGRAMGGMILRECGPVDRLVGIAMAGVPIATAIGLANRIPTCFTRKLEGVRSVEDLKEVITRYGDHAVVEGAIESGDKVVLIDDLVTRFDSKVIAAEQIRFETGRRGLSAIDCSDVAVLFDREQGAAESAEASGMKLHALIRFRTEGMTWLREKMAEEEHAVILDYLTNSAEYQDPAKQKQLEAMARADSPA